MQDLVRQMIEELVGIKLTPEMLEHLTKRFEKLLETNRKLRELDIWQEEPMVMFSREREA